MPNVLILQHIFCETAGTIDKALEAAGISRHVHRSYENEPTPQSMEAYQGLVVMGGPMGVYEHDKYSFLPAEIRLIEQALEAQIPILGVCLGSQLLASALGSKVGKGVRKEIGWYPLELKPAAGSDPLWQGIESPLMGFHWHGDVFDLPAGAAWLASSDLTPCQAFRYGPNAYGLLFHMEVEEPSIRLMVSTFAEDLRDAGIDGRQIIEQASSHLPALQQVGAQVFSKWAALIK